MKFAEVVEIGGVRIGGDLGVNSVLLIGSMFFRGDKHVLDYEQGIIDKGKVKETIEKALEIAYDLDLQLGIDVIMETPKAVENILPQIAETPDELVIFLDSPSVETRVHAYRISHELGINWRSVANAIMPDMNDFELRSITEFKIPCAVVLAFDPRNPSKTLMPKQKLELLKSIILPKLLEYGISNILVDVVVLDVASIALAAKSISEIRYELKVPVGCAPANVLGQISKKNLGIEGAVGLHSGVISMLRVFGADFIFYGPMKKIKYIAHAVAIVDSLLGYIARREGRQVSNRHPLHKYFKKIQEISGRWWYGG